MPCIGIFLFEVNTNALFTKFCVELRSGRLPNIGDAGTEGLASWTIELYDFNSYPHYRACIVSSLALRGFEHSAGACAAAGATGKLDVTHRFSSVENDGTAGNAWAVPESCTADDSCTADGSCSRGILVKPGGGTVNEDVVRARPIDSRDGSAALVWELLDLLHIQLQCLASQRTVRGTVAVGLLHIGRDLQGPFFGPALSCVNEMEQGEDVFPRIAIATEVIERLRSDESLRAGDRGVRNQMDVVDTMTTTDRAGVHYIDYLKASLCDFDYDFARYSDFLEHHKRFVETGTADTRFPENSNAYRRLKDYHNARIDEDISLTDRDHFVNECERSMAALVAPLRIA